MRVHAWAVGLFLVAGAGLATAILFMIGNRHDVFGRHAEFYSEFSDVGGLMNGAQVRVSGLEAGEVKDIAVPAGPGSKFRIRFQVKESVREVIRTDSVVSIQTEGIVGDKYVSVRGGTRSAPQAPDGATLPGKEPFDVAAAMEKGSALLSDVQTSVKDVHGRLDLALDSVTKTVEHADGLIGHVDGAVAHVDGIVAAVGPDIRRMASNASQMTGTVSGMVADLNAGKGLVGLLLKDPATRQQMQGIVSNARQASTNLSDLSAHADQLVADLQSRELAAKVQVILGHVEGMSQRLKEAIDGGLAPDNLGEDGAANLRETLSNLNRGTANLADDTEALKHEFFFRGFFKKRGFYNLEQLTAADYVEGCEQQKACGSRTWLDATKLFAADGDGQEQLVETGRRQIDSAVAPFVDSMLNHVIVVEGYSAAGTPDQQFVASRRRANLVREYLETHFHLIHSDVGIVALRNKPPQGAGRSAWNGIGIVFF